MATQTGTVLKTYFNTGDQPTEAQFGDLIETYILTSMQNEMAIIKIQHATFIKQFTH